MCKVFICINIQGSFRNGDFFDRIKVLNNSSTKAKVEWRIKLTKKQIATIIEYHGETMKYLGYLDKSEKALQKSI